MKKKIVAVIMAMVLMMSLGAVSTFAASSNRNTSSNVGITIFKNRDVVYNKRLPIHSVTGFSGAWTWVAPSGTFITIGVGIPSGRYDKMGTLINQFADVNATNEE